MCGIVALWRAGDRAVVEAIFLVIVIDAVFSIFYQLVGI